MNKERGDIPKISVVNNRFQGVVPIDFNLTKDPNYVPPKPLVDFRKSNEQEKKAS